MNLQSELMKHLLSTCSALLLAAGTAGSATFHVGPAGADANPGTAGRPFATLEAARDAARKSGAESRCIVVMPGDYFLTKTLELDARDNGLTLEAGSGGKITFENAPL